MSSTVFMLFALATQASALEADLNSAFQNEYVYVVSQKQALLRQKQEMELHFKQRTEKVKARVNEMQRELARLTAANDERHEQLIALERQKKDLERRGTSLEATYKKATATLRAAERGLRFESEREKSEVHAPANLTLANLGPIFRRAGELLEASSRSEVFRGHYLDQNERLVEGEILRTGRVAAFARLQDGPFMLGPNGAGNLKLLDKAESGQTYVFEDLSEAALIRKPATIVERLADLAPVLFLLLMLGMVASLFWVLVRI